METKTKAFIFLAEGFEITEAMAPADILTRGSVKTHLIATGENRTVTSAQGISVNAEFTLGEFRLDSIGRDDIIIFPGGMPGTVNLAACVPVMDMMKRHYAEGGTVAAICAAPGLVLSQLPLDETVKSRGYLKMTCYEGFGQPLADKGVTVVDHREGVVADGNIISASGPGHAITFGLKILEYAAGKEISMNIARSLML